MKHILLLQVFLFFCKITLGQNSIKQTNQDIFFRASFEKDTLFLSEKKDIILNLEIKNRSNKVFLFYPNSTYLLSEQIEFKGFHDQFSISLDLIEYQKKSIEVRPDSTIYFNLQFNLKDDNVFIMCRDCIFERNSLFKIIYISPAKNKNRYALISSNVKAFVKKAK